MNTPTPTCNTVTVSIPIPACDTITINTCMWHNHHQHFNTCMWPQSPSTLQHLHVTLLTSTFQHRHVTQTPSTLQHLHVTNYHKHSNTCIAWPPNQTEHTPTPAWHSHQHPPPIWHHHQALQCLCNTITVNTCKWHNHHQLSNICMWQITITLQHLHSMTTESDWTHSNTCMTQSPTPTTYMTSPSSTPMSL